MQRHKTVEAYIKAKPEWRDELQSLRKILQSAGLEETVKWGAPCYTHKGKNLVGIGAFKSYVGLWFFQGALLKDAEKNLVNAQEGKTKAMRQWRFAAKKDIRATKIKGYVKEAIALQDSGNEIKADRDKPIVMPGELAAALRRNKSAAKTFETLTKSKRREYADYVAEAKREETRKKRIEKIIPMIADGKGLNDKYRNC